MLASCIKSSQRGKSKGLTQSRHQIGASHLPQNLDLKFFLPEILHRNPNLDPVGSLDP